LREIAGPFSFASSPPSRWGGGFREAHAVGIFRRLPVLGSGADDLPMFAATDAPLNGTGFMRNHGEAWGPRKGTSRNCDGRLQNAAKALV
jgi:hypothetical protein